ncbi:MAG: autotransporter domain-containing protein [Akkermansiaceae bacterium]|nr:autotransporter domain-containing protein [Akkermansiaceae bacterium]MCP5544762.1 autotransporter domain-containing protein [Akkermansiaceae bacterium]MCP5545900.1 autotransporter domain-containing protein [Akkermansiaceae bacterium]
MKPRKNPLFHFRGHVFRGALIATVFLHLALPHADADWIWTGAVDRDWFKAGNWTSDHTSYSYHRIPAGGDVWIAGGVASTGSLTQLGDLTIDGTMGSAELKTNLTLSGGTLSIVNGGIMSRYRSNSVFAVHNSATLLVSGIHSDGRRSMVTGGGLAIGQWGGNDNVVRVEDGGLIQVDSISVPEHTFTKSSHSTLIVRGVHASGVASEVEAQRIVLGRLRTTTGEIQVLDGGVIHVDSLMSYHDAQVTVSGSAGPDHQSTLRFGDLSIAWDGPSFHVLDGGRLIAGSRVDDVHVSGMDEWGNRSRVDAPEGFSGAFLVENDGLVVSPTVTVSPDGSVLRGSGQGSSAIQLDRMPSHDGGGWLEVDGGTLVVGMDGSLSGETNPVPIVIGGGGMWVDTSKNVALNGAWTRGEGRLHKIGPGTLELLGANLHGGGTFVREGRLILGGDDASLSGDVRVFEGAGLSGSGSVGGDLVNHGSLSPGQSPGVLRIGGSFRQSSSGSLTLEAGAVGASDLMLVGGNAMLGGTLAIENLGTDLEYGDRLALIRARGLKGSFREVELIGFDHFRPSLVRNGGILSLLAAPVSYTAVARDANERSIAGALDSWIANPSGDRGTVSHELDLLSTGEYARAFAAVSPAWIHATDEFLVSLHHTQMFVLDRRLEGRRLMRAAGGPGSNDWDPWGLTYGMFSCEHTLDSFGGDIKSGGLLVGMDRLMEGNIVAGGFMGFGAGEAEAGGLGESSARSFTAGVYSTFEEQGLHGNATFGVGVFDEELEREIRFGGLQRVARADGEGSGIFGSVSGGYSFVRKGLKFGPAAGLFADWTRFDSLREEGAGVLDLRVGSRSAESLRSLVGAEASYEQVMPSGFVLVPQASLFWSHEFLRDSANLHATFEAGRGSAFHYDPDGRDADSLLLNAAMNVLSPWGMHGSIGYQAGFGFDGSLDHSVSVGLDWPF